MIYSPTRNAAHPISEKDVMSENARIPESPVNNGDRIRLTTLTDKGG